MNLLLPRLDRAAANEIIDRHIGSDLETAGNAMPDLPEFVTYAPVGGIRIENDEAALVDLRTALVDLALEHGMPGAITDRAGFEGRAARLLYQHLAMTPHEASQEDVWSYVTCAWLLDIAMWRFGANADVKRFVGDINRNTFRRMWWRAEILGGDIDLTRLGEDELVNIMERPTLASDRRLARAIASEFLERVDRGGAQRRQDLMREGTKRLLRLTPFVAFGSLDDVQLAEVVAAVFEAASASIEGRVPVVIEPRPQASPGPSAEVTEITLIGIARPETPQGRPSGTQADQGGFDTVAQVALELARSTGAVTNMTLREVAHITADEARDVFRELIAEGKLVRRGEKRGTHYVLPAISADEEREMVATEASQRASAAPPTPATPTPRPSDSALRRLLRRGR